MSTNELACSFEEYRRRGKQFVDMLPQVKNLTELDSIWKMVALSYLNLDGHTDQEQHQAVLLLQILARESILREVQLSA